MIWNKHLEIDGTHAFLSPSKYHWINYDDDKLMDIYHNYMAAQRGTELHDFASRCIKLSQKLPNQKKTLNMFVNDAIGYRMESEQTLYFSENCYGTADAISFKKNMLRIHDLKTGKTPSHMEQLMVYQALFCLEYKINPGDIKSELRIYQNDDVMCYSPEVDDIVPIIDKIVSFDKLIKKLNSQL